MTDNPTPDPNRRETDPAADPGPRYWIDDDGNVHGVVLTMRVDHFVEFTDQAIIYPQDLKEPDKPNP